MNLSIKNLYIIIAAFIGLESSFAYYSFYVFPGAGLFFYGIYILVFFLYASRNPLNKLNSKKAKVFLVSYLIIYFLSIFHGFLPVNVEWLILFFGFSFLCMEDEVQYKVLRLFIKMFSILLTVSLVEYLLFCFANVSYVDITIDRGYRTYHHLLFNVFEYENFMILPRFQSILDEPGMVGTFSALILCILWRKNGWLFEKIVFLLAGIFSFSLAFLFMMSIVLLLNFRFKIIHIIIGTALIIGTYVVLQDYIDALVAARFEKENAFTRTAYKFDKAFDNAWKNGELWLGKGATSHKLHTDVDDGNAGIKVWIFQYGILCMIMIMIVYTKIVIDKFRKYTKMNFSILALLLIFWISFYQRSDIEFPYYILMFFGFPTFYKLENNKVEKSKILKQK